MLGARRRLVIIGAGGTGRELLWTAEDVVANRSDLEIAGFVDDSVDDARRTLANAGVQIPVLSATQDHRPRSDEVFVCALGNPVERLAACASLRARGAEFINLFHPTSKIHPSATFGTGIVVRHYSGVGPNGRVDNDVVIGALGGSAHDAVIGEGTVTGSHCDIMGRGAIGRGVILGSHAVIMPWATVGDFATVGAGSVVLRRVPPGATVFGVPAKRLAFVPDRHGAPSVPSV